MKEWTFKWASPQAELLDDRDIDPEVVEEQSKRWSHMDHVVLIEMDGWAWPGVALCSGQDTYSKRKGWKMARGRAALALGREANGRPLRKSLLHGIKLDGPLNISKARELAMTVHAQAHDRRKHRHAHS